MEPTELPAATTHHEWTHDWDLLSPRFQAEAAGYLQVVGVFVAVFLLAKRGRVFTGTTLFRGTPSAPSTSQLSTEAKESS